MPRPLRAEAPGAVYHVTARGVARQTIFTDDGERELFLERLHGAVQRHEWCCHAYCLMGNHYHILVETPQPNLAAGMQVLNGTYAQRFNRRHERVGHLFQGRYQAVPVARDAHLLEAARYIVLNPVRASICRVPFDWPWSSYRATAGHAAPPPFLTTALILGQLALEPRRAVERYRAFIADVPRR